MSASQLVQEMMRAAESAPTAKAAITGALAYVRVSTDMQEERGLSIPAQLAAIQAYARQHGIQVLETYQEAASGFQAEVKRVEFQRMLERAKSDRRVGLILVHEFSRFSRDPWRTPQVIGELQVAGVQVVSVTEPAYDVNTVMGMWMQKVTEAKNASYSMEVAFHTRKGMRQNVNVRDRGTGWCYKNGGKPPWGYKTKRIERVDVRGRPRFKAVWELDTTEVAGRTVWQWTRKVLLRSGQGASLDTLRDMLNEAGVPAPRGGAWGTSTLHSLLEPHMLLQYAGYGTWGVRKKRRQRWNRPEDWEVVENAHPAIIGEDECKSALRARQAALEASANCSERMSRIRSQSSRFLLSGGLFKCARCGANMAGHTDRGRDGYLCGSAKYRRGLGCGASVFVEKGLIEDTAWDMVGGLADAVLAGRSRQLLATANAQLRKQWEEHGGKGAAAARKRLEKFDQKISNLRSALEDGLLDVGWATGRINELLREREEALAACGTSAIPTQPPAIDETQLRRYLSDLPRLLPHATNREKRELARLFLDRVTLNPETREIEVRVKLPANTLQRMEAARHVGTEGQRLVVLVADVAPAPANGGEVPRLEVFCEDDGRVRAYGRVAGVHGRQARGRAWRGRAARLLLAHGEHQDRHANSRQNSDRLSKRPHVSAACFCHQRDLVGRTRPAEPAARPAATWCSDRLPPSLCAREPANAPATSPSCVGSVGSAPRTPAAGRRSSLAPRCTTQCRRPSRRGGTPRPKARRLRR